MKTFTTKQEIRDLLNKVIMDEISFSRMVEILNERVSEAEKPVRKFQKGDKVRIKEGISSKTHSHSSCSFIEDMDKYIGQELVVYGVLDHTQYGIIYTMANDLYTYAEDWLEPYTDELKKRRFGDILG